MMARQPVLFSRVVKPVQLWWQKFAFSLAIIISLTMMLIDRAQFEIFDDLRTTLTDIAIPVVSAISDPIRSTSEMIADIDQLRHASVEIDRLKTENRKLRETQTVTTALAVENATLRKLTNFVAFPDTKTISGRVITASGGSFVKSLLINIGRKQGARRGQAVMSDFGFVGTIVEVGERFARVLLITDLNSQIPVVIRNTRDPGVMMGDNSNWPRLMFLPSGSLVAVGDMIVTSGRGGVLPPDLPIGTVLQVNGTNIRIASLVDWTRLDYIRVLDYRLLQDILLPRRAVAK